MCVLYYLATVYCATTATNMVLGGGQRAGGWRASYTCHIASLHKPQPRRKETSDSLKSFEKLSIVLLAGTS
jgi:hypothetical protein